MDNFWKDKKVIITGGAGLIGSALACDLVLNGSKVTVIDDFSRGKEEFLQDVIDDIEIIRFDLCDYSKCEMHIKDADIVVHLASKVGGIKVYTDNPFSIMNDNLVMDSNTIRASIKNNIKQFFYASSAHVYPIELQNNPNKTHFISENRAYPADPLLTYGWAKLISEKQLISATHEYEDFSVAIARYIGIYGSNQDYGLQTGSVIPVFSHRAIKYPSVDFTIWGDGKETRSYCYIDDAVQCTKMMIEKMKDVQIVGPYNVGSNDIVKIKEIAQKIVAISGKDVKIEFDTSKKAKILSQWCDCSCVFEEIGWQATTSFDDGLEIVYNDIERRIK
jgi:UDP-glucose 4-epimerase